ncbi:2-C-methyl-D-erythritol 4-phosphate cytidylyltransferase [Aquimixticola soesokkakensis]|uniref:2-C-methyl-D-erythritol 4-phosphate cytidylyltransferase n=2 Tax=Aquimixticola soesokkakensis TaxID=1519096 RepID=A0A1Y5RDA1_9RHOB|nr:2-C-methyl-D-erythritol 4-phosphate cytidylyltransferase [Aquimixticola soesokkakensis]
MFFAAGFGTRMGALTNSQPKPMIPVAGQPLIDHAIAQMAQVDRKLANLHYRPDALETHLHARGVQTIREFPDILETGGGLRNALPILGDGPVFTMNTDAVWTGTAAATQLLRAWDPEKMDALLLLARPSQTRGHTGGGDFEMDTSGRLTRGRGAVYTGAQIINPIGIDQIAEPAFSLNLLWEKMIARGRLFGTYHDGLWCDVGHPKGLAIAEDMLAGQRHV